MEFKAWPKTPRLFRDIVVTEKIDGTNSAIIINEHPFGTHIEGLHEKALALVMGPLDEGGTPDVEYVVGAQSRNRLITPGKQTDNYGFARWVEDNADDLVKVLGPGVHYGEWWGKGIARGYGQERKRFSLFNVHRYSYIDLDPLGSLYGELDVVPVLYQGENTEARVRGVVSNLSLLGSVAAPGFDRPEGVCVFHTASGQVYKVLIENDELPKGKVPYSEKVLNEQKGFAA